MHAIKEKKVNGKAHFPKIQEDGEDSSILLLQQQINNLSNKLTEVNASCARAVSKFQTIDKLSDSINNLNLVVNNILTIQKNNSSWARGILMFITSLFGSSFGYALIKFIISYFGL